MKKMLTALVVISVLGCSGVFCSRAFAMDKPLPVYNQGVTLKNTIVTVPAGVCIKGVFLAPVSSSLAYTGQEISLALSRDFYYNGNLIAPVGSAVTGTVIDVARAKHGALNGKITLRFTHIITPSGADIPISAMVKTDDHSGIIYGGMKWDVLTEYNTESAIEDESAIARTIAPPAVYSVAGGNNVMPALGSGGGLVKSIWDKGSEVEIPVNSPVELILIQPITTDPASYEN